MDWSAASLELEQHTTEADVWGCAVSSFEAAGFGCVIYLSSDASRTNTVLLINTPQIYDGIEPGEDPFLEYCCHSYEITRTGPAYLSRYDYLPPAAQDFVARIADHGLLTGYGIPVRIHGATRFGGFIIGSTLDVAEFEDRHDKGIEAIRAFCLLLHRQLEESGYSKRHHLKSLSPREQDVIDHVIKGATRKEVARALNLSPNTVAEYTKSAYRKLQVRNKVEAIRKLTGEA